MSIYVNAVESILKKAYSEIDSTPCKSAIIAISTNPYLTEIGKEKFISNIKRKYYYIIDEARNNISTAYNEYVKRLDNAIKELIENSYLDQQDLLMLLSGLLSLSNDDFNKIAEKHKNNYAMQEAISKYAESHKIRYQTNCINRDKKIKLADEVKNYAFNKLDDNIFHMPLYIGISESTKKYLVE